MDVRAKMVDKFLRYYFRFQTRGREAEFIEKKDGASFYCRKSTSDLFVTNEIWNKTYPVELSDDSIVVDAGANIGAFAIYAALKVPGGQVHAFEPDKSNRQQLEKNVQLNELAHVKVYADALAGKREKRTLYLSRSNKGSSSLIEAHSSRSLEIECIPLADVFGHCQIDHIDLLKIDVEGAEYDILFSTPPEVFEKIKHIILEFHDFLGLGHRAGELVSLLEKFGYEVSYGSSPLSRAILKQGIINARR